MFKKDSQENVERKEFWRYDRDALGRSDITWTRRANRIAPSHFVPREMMVNDATNPGRVG